MCIFSNNQNYDTAQPGGAICVTDDILILMGTSFENNFDVQHGADI